MSSRSATDVTEKSSDLSNTWFDWYVLRARRSFPLNFKLVYDKKIKEDWASCCEPCLQWHETWVVTTGDVFLLKHFVSSFHWVPYISQWFFRILRISPATELNAQTPIETLQNCNHKSKITGLLPSNWTTGTLFIVIAYYCNYIHAIYTSTEALFWFDFTFSL